MGDTLGVVLGTYPQRLIFGKQGREVLVAQSINTWDIRLLSFGMNIRIEVDRFGVCQVTPNKVYVGIDLDCQA